MCAVYDGELAVFPSADISSDEIIALPEDRLHGLKIADIHALVSALRAVIRAMPESVSETAFDVIYDIKYGLEIEALRRQPADLVDFAAIVDLAIGGANDGVWDAGLARAQALARYIVSSSIFVA